MPFIGPASASAIGRAIASPTIDSELAPSRFAVSITSIGSNLRISTTFEACMKPIHVPSWAAPCIKGATGNIVRLPRLTARSATSSGRVTGMPTGSPPPMPAKNRSS